MFLANKMSRIHYFSRMFKPKIDIPVGADFRKDTLSKSHKLFLELGMIRSSTNGMNAILPVLMRSIDKLTHLIRVKMGSISAEEIYLPMMTPSAWLSKTGRSTSPELFLLQDRHDQQFVLSPTHEEAITNLMANECISWKHFPIRLFQMTNKYRDEMKPRFGLMRSKEFLMKDLYCFDCSLAEAENSYNEVRKNYAELLDALKVPFTCVEGDPGDIGGSVTHEYHILSDIGEDKLVLCQECNFSANVNLTKDTNKCSRCGSGNISTPRGIEVGHTFLLGTKYTSALNCKYKDKLGKPKFLYMSCHGIGITRLLAAAVEVLSTQQEIKWPSRLAPYVACVIPPKKGSKEEKSTADALTTAGELSKILDEEIVVDDRTDFTIGKRFLEVKKLGVPYIVVFGKESVADKPLVELHDVYQGTVDKVEAQHVSHLVKSKLNQIQS